MANYDEEQRRLAAGLPPRSECEVYAYRTERWRANETKRMLEWQADPEGMAEKVRALNAKRFIEDQMDSEKVEERIQELKMLGGLWPQQITDATNGSDLV
jgi:hypothetical protein